ncbi:ankyrin [Ceraceosorus guamensis]|uniref:Ankyrin n=1 Tax=Ceraceosorus guamensis TaxID=1522189 RepID=A0A316W0V8_9BASI|nr:ankyrin [Ceraceosorus guamensis]PWN41305.1 ankyrin [Ceraceosorus guamensis]
MPVAVSPAAAQSSNIWIAAGEGDDERVTYLIEVEDISPTAPDSNTYTPLHAAASYSHSSTLQLLLAHSKTPSNAVNIQDSDGDTPLFVVEEVAIAELLIKHGGDAFHKNKAGDTPAEVAEENGFEEVAEYLRSITGEKRLYERPGDGPEDEEESELTSRLEDEEGASLTPAARDLIDQRTEALMSQVESLLSRASLRSESADRGESGAELKLTNEEEEELRRLVGESVLEQIREGWAGNEGPGQQGEVQGENDSRQVNEETRPAGKEPEPR